MIGGHGSYPAMITAHLLDLSRADLASTRLIGPLHTVDLPGPHDRFNGRGSPNPGTRVDFPQRATRHFVEHIYPSAEGASPSEHARRVAETLAALSWPERSRYRELHGNWKRKGSG